MNKDEALQKVNEYCGEKSYTTATLTNGFKEKFAEHFAKRYPDTDVNDENALADMKFALNTAFSGASLIITEKTKEFETKENAFKSEIEELKKRTPNPDPNPKDPPKLEIPKEIQDQLDELKKFKSDEGKKEKFKNIMDLAKKGIRQDLHVSFEKFAADYDVKLDKEDKEQADALANRFQEIFKDTIGDIKPLAPKQAMKRDEELISSIPKVTVQ